MRNIRLFMIGLMACGLFFAPADARASDAKHKFNFLVAHKPDNADHLQLIREFARRVKAGTAGNVAIELSFSDASPQRTLGRAMRQVYAGDVEMSQIPVNRFLEVSQELDVLDMPMMFRSHAHAHMVLDGEIGRDLMATVNRGSNGRVRGLAFTYSGGWRNIYSLKAIDSLADLQGMSMRVRSSRMNTEAMEHLGVDFFKELRWRQFYKKHMNGSLGAEEAETNRIMSYRAAVPEMVKKIDTVLETNHSLYLTMITINGAAMDRLSKEEQAVLQREANWLAQEERALSIRQEQEGKKVLAKEGITFRDISAADRKQLEAIAAKMYKKYDRQLGHWIRRIKAVDASSLARKN